MDIRCPTHRPEGMGMGMVSAGRHRAHFNQTMPTWDAHTGRDTSIDALESTISSEAVHDRKIARTASARPSQMHSHGASMVLCDEAGRVPGIAAKHRRRRRPRRCAACAPPVRHVAGRLIFELLDAFAQVSLDHRYAALLEKEPHVAFVRQHC